MKYRPILFSGEMVRAVLDGRKTQTRRVIKPAFGEPDKWGVWGSESEPSQGYFILCHEDGGEPNYELVKNCTCGWANNPDWTHDDLCKTQICEPCKRPPKNPNSYPERVVRCPYGSPDDRLWVREAFQIVGRNYQPTTHITKSLPAGCEVLYRQRDERGWLEFEHPSEPFLWRPSIHMPRCASRITLEVVSVRVERLQEITVDDCIAEGVHHLVPCGFNEYGDVNAYAAFRDLWDSINSKPRKDGTNISWSANPWVWVVEFKREEGGGA